MWVYLWLILVDVWQKITKFTKKLQNLQKFTKFCKASILQLKKKKKDFSISQGQVSPLIQK